MVNAIKEPKKVTSKVQMSTMSEKTLTAWHNLIVKETGCTVVGDVLPIVKKVGNFEQPAGIHIDFGSWGLRLVEDKWFLEDYEVIEDEDETSDEIVGANAVIVEENQAPNELDEIFNS